MWCQERWGLELVANIPFCLVSPSPLVPPPYLGASGAERRLLCSVSFSAPMTLTRRTDFYFLHSTCKVVVLLCLVHISVTLVFYVRSLDLRFAFAQNQQSGGSSSSNVSQRNQVQDSRITVVTTTRSQQLNVAVQQKSQPDVKKLEKCPETSPLLGKSESSHWVALNDQ